MLDMYSPETLTHVFRWIGVAGFVTYVAVYAALCLGVWAGDSLRYFCGNTLAAGLVLISLSAEFNLASALIQSFWIVMGCIAILLRLVRRASDRRADQAAARWHPHEDPPIEPLIPPREAAGRRRPAASGYAGRDRAPTPGTARRRGATATRHCQTGIAG